MISILWSAFYDLCSIISTIFYLFYDLYLIIYILWSRQIRNAETETCLDTMGRKYNEKVGISYCHGLGGNQVFAYTKRQQIMSDDLCLDAASSNGPVNMVRCHNMGGNQEWVYDAEVSIA